MRNTMGFAAAALLVMVMAGCSKPDGLIASGTVVNLKINSKPVGSGGQWETYTYGDDGKTAVSVYEEFIIVRQNGVSRVVPHGWYSILEYK